MNSLFGCERLCDFKIVDYFPLEVVPAKIFARIEESLLGESKNPFISIVAHLQAIRADSGIRAEFTPTI
jgi:hypothetical protein